MKNRIIIIAVIVIVALFSATPVLAYDPPEQGTDPATDVIIWYSEPLDVDPVTVSIDMAPIVDAMNDTAEYQAEVMAEIADDISGQYFLLLLMAGIIALVFWQRQWFLYAAGSAVTIVYGVSLTVGADVKSVTWMAGVFVSLIGTYFIYRIVIEAIIPKIKRNGVK